MTFRRARSDEQREERRRAILATTAAMLAEMPVADVSLNEISRRVGLAKSNVLRYVESREAALLDLLHAELAEWLEIVRASPPASGSVRERVDGAADLVARTLAERPVLCDLLGAQAAVLERNVSTDLAVRHKRESMAAAGELAAVLRGHVPELSEDASVRAAGAAALCAGAAWTATQPSAAMCVAYDENPDLAAMRLDFGGAVRELVAVLISGLLARES
ncbi:TetR family transcriptional regulator [Actinomycetospora sp. NBRC 106375]|uniref:TetR/AcrR family transcriptional regulator n=1 Tax=Actinomycetospora sp. NBRC 106375 TaxID=3032207 RepID=UPI0024A2F29A|nr:TetR/AcrR family transcriptional regulator [Actinomycetospora sp. NBRC 106375]GLZ46680.1 TetR family transcriptional regulator [Actinomycetospora sp. NBRC 106375]